MAYLGFPGVELLLWGLFHYKSVLVLVSLQLLIFLWHFLV